MLFKPHAVSSRQTTMLAYKLRYFPSKILLAEHKRLIVWSHKIVITKAQLLERLDESMTSMLFKQETFKIHWAFNNIPTELEWTNKHSSAQVRCEFRISPVLGNPIVVLDFDLAPRLASQLF